MTTRRRFLAMLGLPLIGPIAAKLAEPKADSMRVTADPMGAVFYRGSNPPSEQDGLWFCTKPGPEGGWYRFDEGWRKIVDV